MTREKSAPTLANSVTILKLLSFPSRTLRPVHYLSAIGLTLLLVIAALSYRTTNQYLDSAKWRIQTDKVIASVHSLEVGVESLRTHHHDYVITGDRVFVEPYEALKIGIASEIQGLKNLMADNSEQSNRLTALAKNIQAEIHFLNHTMDIVHAGRPADAVATIKRGTGIQLMSEIRQGLSELESAENKILGERISKAESDFRRATTFEITGMALAFLFLFANTLLLNSENRARVKSETELQMAKARAVEASTSKSTFLANMSHEIRTPLNGIIGMSKLLEQTEMNERQRDYVETVKVSSNSLLALINQILDLSKIEAGKLQLEDTHFEFKSLIDSTVSIVAFAAKAKALEIQTRIGPDVPEFFLGDALRLRQVLLNLLQNSIKFSEKGIISLNIHKLAEADSKTRLLIEVVDQGVGIDPSARDRLFQSFSQGDESTSRKFGGTGLGLSISKQIVHMMGGEIDVESIKGVGSRFFFDVFLKIAKYDDVVRPVSFDKMALKSLNGYVLIAEDNLVNQKVIVEMMALLGCRSRVANDGVQALQTLKGEEFNLVLMDGQMPIMDGYECTRRIREGLAGEFNRKIPIIATTANAIQGDIEKCLDAGMNDYIGKPISYDDLAYKVEKWMTRGRKVIDSAAIDRLRLLASKGNKTLVADLVAIFKTDTPKALQGLRNHLDAKNLSQVTQVAHNIKSSSANLGALRMRELSERIERARSESNHQHIQLLIGSLEREFVLAVEELDLLIVS